MSRKILISVVAVLMAAMAAPAMARGRYSGHSGGRSSFGFSGGYRSSHSYHGRYNSCYSRPTYSYCRPTYHHSYYRSYHSYGFGFGYYRPAYYRPVYYPAPVYVAPAPMVVQQPVVYQQPAAYMTPAPQPRVQQAPAPAPVSLLSEAEQAQLAGAFPNGFVVIEIDRHESGSDAGQLDDLRVELPDGSRHKVEWENGKIQKIK